MMYLEWVLLRVGGEPVPKKILLGGVVAASSVAAAAQLTGHREWPMAATSLMLTAIGSHNQAMLDRVITPGATYFADWQAEEQKQSTPLSLDSFANVRDRCKVSSVHACNALASTVEWSCQKPGSTKVTEIWSRVSLADSGKIVSATGDTAPLVCTEVGPSPETD